MWGMAKIAAFTPRAFQFSHPTRLSVTPSPPHRRSLRPSQRAGGQPACKNAGPHLETCACSHHIPGKGDEVSQGSCCAPVDHTYDRFLHFLAGSDSASCAYSVTSAVIVTARSHPDCHHQ